MDDPDSDELDGFFEGRLRSVHDRIQARIAVNMVVEGRVSLDDYMSRLGDWMLDGNDEQREKAYLFRDYAIAYFELKKEVAHREVHRSKLASGEMTVTDLLDSDMKYKSIYRLLRSMISLGELHAQDVHAALRGYWLDGDNIQKALAEIIMEELQQDSG